MNKLNYDGLTESQQEQVESLIADLEGRQENNSSIISFVAEGTQPFVAAGGNPIDHLSQTSPNKMREDANYCQ